MSAKIAAALHEVMSKVGYVQKTGKNDFHGYRYAGEAALLERLRPAMVDAGLLLIPSAEEVSPADAHGNVTVRIAYTLAHKDGDVWPTPVYAVGCGNDRAKNGNIGDKGVYKAITGANKYLLFKLFQIETGDDPEKDDNAEHAPPVAVKSSYALKKENPGRWNEIEALIRSAQTLDQLRAIYPMTKIERASWPQHWKDAWEEEVMKKREELEALVG